MPAWEGGRKVESKLELESKQAAELLAKYDKDQSGLMEFDEFGLDDAELCASMEAYEHGL